MQFGGWELIVILVIVILIFGVGRVGRVGGELGQAVSNFRRNVRDTVKENENKTETPDDTKA